LVPPEARSEAETVVLRSLATDQEVVVELTRAVRAGQKSRVGCAWVPWSVGADHAVDEALSGSGRKYNIYSYNTATEGCGVDGDALSNLYVFADANGDAPFVRVKVVGLDAGVLEYVVVAVWEVWTCLRIGLAFREDEGMRIAGVDGNIDVMKLDAVH
jgi:hypothetical protein